MDILSYKLCVVVTSSKLANWEQMGTIPSGFGKMNSVGFHVGEGTWNAHPGIVTILGARPGSILLSFSSLREFSFLF